MEDACGVLAEDRRLGAPIEAGFAHETKGVGIAQPERMVAAEHDAIVADDTDEITEGLRPLDERVVVEAPEIAARKPGSYSFGGGWRGPRRRQ